MNEPIAASTVPLAPKYKGMRVSAAGLMRGKGHGLQEMAANLREMARCYYAGEIEAVDLFCQMYCLADDRPKGEKVGG